MTRQTLPQFAFSAGEVSPLLYSRPDYQRTQQGLRACNGFLPLRQGGLTRAPGTVYQGDAASTSACRLVPFEFSALDAVVLEFTPNKMRVWRYGNLVDAPGTPGVPFELVTPYDAQSIKCLQWVQSADVIYMADGTQAIQKLARLALDDWTIVPFEPDTGPFMAATGQGTITASSVTGNFTLTSTAAVFDASMVGSLIRVEIDGFEISSAWQANEAVSFPTYRHYDGRVYFTSQTISDVGTVPPTHTKGTEQVASGVNWVYWHDKVGIAKITGFNSPTSVDVVGIKRFPDEMTTTGADNWQLGAWSDYAGFPKALAIVDQRLAAGGTTRAPRTISFSQLGIFDDWTPGILDTDGFSYTVSGSLALNDIEWLSVGQHGLYVGTTGEILSAQRVNSSLSITPSNFSIQPLATLGASKLPPIAPTGFPIFVAKDRTRVFELRYANADQGPQPRELSLPADHICNVGLASMAMQSTAHPLIWFVRDDGTLAAMLYDPDQDVLGWVPLSLAIGLVESLAVTTDAVTGTEVVTLAVRRMINGQLHLMIEEMATPYGTLNTTTQITAANHLFAASVFGPNANTDTFTVAHMVGEDVWAWTDQGAFGPFTVPAGGQITLPEIVQSATIGLHDPNHYVDLMALHPVSSAGDTLADQRRILPDSAVVLHRTTGGTVETLERLQNEQGWHANRAEHLVQKDVLDTTPKEVSGPVNLQSQSGMAAEVSMRFRPLPGDPMSVLAVVPAVQREAS